MTTTLTVTDADRGNEIATNQAVVSVKMTVAPPQYEQDYLSLADGERVVFNMHVSTSAVSADSILFSGIGSFESLVVKEIPTGCQIEIEVVDPPTLTSLSPNTAASGDPDFVLSCIGTNFVEGTVIYFGSTTEQDEPTTLVSDTEVTTGVKPSLFAPAVVPVTVRTGKFLSDPVDFTFT
jgi:hypothetical protein